MEIKEILQQLNEEFSLIVTQVNKVDEAAFFSKINNEKWSVAEHLLHLSLSLLPVNNLLKQPELMLERWGNSNRKSKSIEVFLDDYKKAVASVDWKAFPPFVPKSEKEVSDYLKLHATTSESKVNEFYQFTGEQIIGLREKIFLSNRSTKNEVLELVALQYRTLTVLSQNLTEMQMDELQIPLPYVGLITCKEMLYFTYNHTKVHRLAVENLLFSS
jgi:hypothetical protein